MKSEPKGRKLIWDAATRKGKTVQGKRMEQGIILTGKVSGEGNDRTERRLED